MHRSLFILQTAQYSCTNAVFLFLFFHCMNSEGMSRRWRDTAPFGLTCFPLLIMTWIMEPAVILR